MSSFLPTGCEVLFFVCISSISKRFGNKPNLASVPWKKKKKMRGLTPIFLFFSLALCFTVFFVMAEMCHRDKVLETTCREKIFTSQFPVNLYRSLVAVQDKVTKTLVSVGDGVGLRVWHVPFRIDLGSVADFITRKISKYDGVKSLTVKHVYFASSVFRSSQPKLQIQTPTYGCSLFFVSLRGPLEIYLLGNKRKAQVPVRMLGFTKVLTKGERISVVGDHFCYGIVAPVRTSDFQWCQRLLHASIHLLTKVDLVNGQMYDHFRKQWRLE